MSGARLRDEHLERGHAGEAAQDDVLGFGVGCQTETDSIERRPQLRNCRIRVEQPGELALQIDVIALQKSQQIRRHVENERAVVMPAPCAVVSRTQGTVRREFDYICRRVKG